LQSGGFLATVFISEIGDESAGETVEKVLQFIEENPKITQAKL
jgi:hypothetical protein